jgi:O-antigen ligase
MKILRPGSDLRGPKQGTDAHIRIPLVLSFYILMFLAVPGYGQYCQMASLFLLMLQGVFLLLEKLQATGGTMPPAPLGSRLSPFSLLMIYIIPLQSLLANIKGPDIFFAQFSLMFFLVTLAILSITHDLAFRTVLNSFACAAAAILVTLLATSAGDLRLALSIQIDLAAGLLRYTPLGLHPNLLGHMCGTFAIVFFCYFLHMRTNKLLRYAALLLMGVALVVCVGTSSRGGTLSSLTAIVVLQILAIWDNRRMRRNVFLCLSLVMVVMLASGGLKALQSYLTTMLAFDNDYRGVNSGLSGRTDGWERLFEAWLASPQSILIGNGLRTGSEDLLGYNIDSGYLTMLYELGLFATTMFVGFLITGLFKLTASIRHQPDLSKSVALGIFIFILMESVVARYLLSLGNPGSLLVIYCMLGLKTILNADAAKNRYNGPATSAWSPI